MYCADVVTCSEIDVVSINLLGLRPDNKKVWSFFLTTCEILFIPTQIWVTCCLFHSLEWRAEMKKIKSYLRCMT